MRFLTTVFAFATLVAQTTFAGEAAELNVIGFSEDGRSFAFEQYGVFEGGPTAFAELF